MKEEFMKIEEIKKRMIEIDNILFEENNTLSDMERKSLETEKEDLKYYLE